MADHSRRSSSHDVDSDFEDHDHSQPGKPGRKKNPNSQAARRDQNRIAQREFRLRKAQRIRDLEARVEILSGTKDEAVTEMGNVLKDLMAENQTLRGLLRSLAAFIGEGAGGLLPKLGWDQVDFEQFVNKGETDTAHESYERRKKARADAVKNGSKRPGDSTGGDEARKRARNDSQDSAIYPGLMSMDSPIGTPDFVRNHSSASPMFMQPSTSQQFSMGYKDPNAYLAGSGLQLDSSLIFGSSPLPTNSASASTSVHTTNSTNETSNDNPAREDDPSYTEAQKLIAYHLDNYKRNNAYCLPASLRPTLIQRTVPHESVVDRILHPEIRDRMILLRGRFDLIGCMMDFRNETTIHGDDVLSHSNWELSEKWLRKYGYLVEAPTLVLMNRWRRERGEPELVLSELASAETTLGPPVPVT